MKQGLSTERTARHGLQRMGAPHHAKAPLVVNGSNQAACFCEVRANY